MKWDLAVEVSRTAVEVLGGYIEHSVLFESMAQWGVSLRLAGRFDEARGVYRRLVRAAHHRRRTEYVIRGRVGLANVLMDRGNLPEARTRIDEVITKTRSMGDPRLRSVLSRALHTRSNVAAARHEMSEALASAHEALELCDDVVERENILHDIAAALIELGCLSEARDALVLVRRTAINQANRLSAAVNLMEIAARQGRPDAFERWRRELEAQPLRPLHQAQFIYLVGEGYERLGEYGRALETYKAAVARAEKLGINDVIIRAELRAREVRAGRYLSAPEPAGSRLHTIKRLIEAVGELRLAAGSAAGDEP
jgi:tetratricopeptide (TPR) repeat protein